MPQICCAVKCSHTSFNCRLKRFPTDLRKGSDWEANVLRKDWKRKDHHRICECHFDSLQFEKNGKNGKRKLRRDAVPLIFPTHTICGVNKDGVKVALLQPATTSTNSRSEPSSETPGASSNAKIMTRSSSNAKASVTLLVPILEAPSRETADNESSSSDGGNVILDNDSSTSVVNKESLKICVPALDTSDVETASIQSATSDGNVTLANSSSASVGIKEAPENSAVDPEGFISLEEHNKKLEDMKSRLQRKVWRLQKARLKEETRYHNLLESLSDLFTEDQLQHLTQKKVSKWSKESMRKGLQIRYACGIRGYRHMIKQGFPLPSYQSLCRNVQKMSLDPGVSELTIELLTAKGRMMNEKEKCVVLSVDEMDIASKLEFDSGRKKVVGYTTLGQEGNRASKLLLLVARGVTSDWKQPIGWHLTDGVTGLELQAFVLEGVRQMEEAGYSVVGCVSDMGAENLSMWNTMGITVERWSVDKTTIPHPCRPTENLHVFADVGHILKNIRSEFLTHKIHLPAHVVEKHNLPTDTVSSSYISDYLSDKCTTKITTKLAPHVLNTSVTAPNSFAVKLMSHDTACELRTAVQRSVIPNEALTTAWFIETIADWFSTVTARHLDSSITRENVEANSKQLSEFVELMRKIRTEDGKWKPFQKGAILSTLNIISVVSILLKSGSVSNVLTSRFTQDALEIVFSSVSYRGTELPTPLQALRAVRSLSVSLFTSDLKNSGYEISDDLSYIDFLSSPVKKKEKTCREQQPKTSTCSRLLPLEDDALLHYAGTIVAKIWNSLCVSCKILFQGSQNELVETDHVYSKFTGLKHSSESALDAARLLEKFCCEHMDITSKCSDQVVEQLCAKVVSSVECVFPQCVCNVSQKFCRTYINSRLQFRSAEKRKLDSTKCGNGTRGKKSK